MCWTGIEVGIFDEEVEKKFTREVEHWGPYVDYTVMPLENLETFKNESEAILLAIELKLNNPNKRILVREIFWCSGVEPNWIFELIDFNKAKIISCLDGSEYLEKMVSEFKIEIINLDEYKNEI